MLGLGLGLNKKAIIRTIAQKLYTSYKARVAANNGVQQNAACDIAALSKLNTSVLLNQASWVLVPDGIEEDIVFVQKPTSGLGDLTFTRASDATYTDSTGVVRRSPYNLATSSSDFSQVFQLLNSTITTNTITDPFGTLLGDSQLETIATDVHAGYNDYTVLVGSQYTYSVYVKSIGGRDVRVSGSSGFGGSTAIVNLSNGAILSSTGTIQVSAAGNGWYRISITATATTTTARIIIYSAIGTTTTFAGDVTKGIYLFGRQFVEGTSALDYFPTTDRLNVPRIDFRNADGTLSSCGRLLLEPQRTNSIRNSSMVGAVAGSPGTTPTNWAISNAGLTQTIVGIGNESGLPYIDLRFNGTATSIFFELRPETPTGIAASNAQIWTFASYLKFTSGSIPISLGIYERTSAGSFITSGQAMVSVTSTLQRFAFTRTLSGGATVGAVQPTIISGLTNGAAYDFTIRLAAPQMELGAYATTWVPTTTAAVTRLADRVNISTLGLTNSTFVVNFRFLNINVELFDFQKSGNIRMFYIAVNSLRIITFNAVSGGTIGAVGSALTLGQTCKLAFTLNASTSNVTVFINGSKIGTYLTDITSFIGFRQLEAFGFSQGTAIEQIDIYPSVLSDAECIQRTTL